MDRTRLFLSLSKHDSSMLLDLLRAAYDKMTHDQRQVVFGRYYHAMPPAPVDGETLLQQVEAFRRASLARAYYAPFNISSRNCRYVPEKTKEWFECLNDFLEACSHLTTQGDDTRAVVCFGILYELIDGMERGEEIVFAEEYGSWMIPGDEKQYIAAYMTSLAATSTAEEFTKVALPLIRATAGNRSRPAHTYRPCALLAKLSERNWKRKSSSRTSEQRGTAEERGSQSDRAEGSA